MVVVFLFSIMGIGLLLLFNYYDIGIPCLFHQLTGLYCPGCGLTRAFIMLQNFDLFGAIRMNALIVFIPIVLIYIIISMIRYIKNTKPYFLKIPQPITYLILFLVVIFGIIRNIPGFEYFRPY